MIIVLSIVMYSMAHAQQRSVPLIDRIMLTPVPTEPNAAGRIEPFPSHISVHGLDPSKPGDQATLETFIQHFKMLPQTKGDFGGDASYRISFEWNTTVENAEGYELMSDSSGIVVRASTEAGAFYGAQTIYQLLAYSWHGEKFLPYSKLPAEGWGKHFVPVLTINDKPAYMVRSFMLDLGTAVYSMPLLKRLIRMMAQLKINTLHLYLWDHQLCSFRFRNLPLGHENPFALDLADLTELVRYARRYHIAVMPELESWGNVGSITYHYPELNGGSGDYGGTNLAWSPFAIKYPSDDPRDGLGERTRQRINQQMRSWQTIFPDADPAAINTDRGPEVKSGYYQWLPYAGKPVAPTVDACRASKSLTE